MALVGVLAMTPWSSAMLVAPGSPVHAAHVARPALRAPLGAVQCQAGGLMAKVKEINEANKMPAMKKNQAPSLRGTRLPPSMVELTSKFKKTYPTKDLEVLWSALLKCYGNVELAEQAAKTNPQIINPSYSFCNTMFASQKVLVDMMGKEEALDVMLKNPAVLQCGPSLDTLGPDEIKGFANLRSLGNSIPEAARGWLLSATIAFVLFPVIAQYNEDLSSSFAMNLVKPLVGIFFGIAIEGSRILIVGTIVKAKMSGDERIKIAEENERRRMGGKKSTR